MKLEEIISALVTEVLVKLVMKNIFVSAILIGGTLLFSHLTEFDVSLDNSDYHTNGEETRSIKEKKRDTGENISSFPKSSCGDLLPDNESEYPILFYPVEINYTSSNLQYIKSNFCGDAYKKISKTTGQIVIQVASFSEFQRAQTFQNLMLREVGSGDIGNPTKIWHKP